MENRATILNTLAGFIGTEHYYRLNPMTPNIVATDGVKYLCDAAEAYWLFNIIALQQHALIHDPRLHDIQFWTLTVKDKQATLICERDTDDVALRIEVGYTDFPLDSIRLWVEWGGDVWVMMLPSER